MSEEAGAPGPGKSPFQGSSDMYRTIVDNAFGGIYLIRESKYEYVNPRFCEITGYSFEELTSPDFDPQVMLAPESQEFARSRYEARKRGVEVSDNYEITIINKKGTLVYLDVRTKAIGGAGEVAALGVMRDITEQKKAEEQITRSEKRLRKLMDAVPIGIAVTNLQGGILESNAQVREMMGYDTHQEIAAHPATSFYADPEQREKIVTRLKQDGFVKDLELRLKRRDGSVFWCLVSTQTQESEHGELQFLHTFQDIEERKKTEEQFTLFKRFAEASGQGFAMGNLDGKVLYVNPAMCQIMGATAPGDLVGTSFVLFYQGAYGEKLRNEVLPTLMKEGRWSGEMEMRVLDGRTVSSFESYFLIKDGRGEPHYLANVITDVTQRKGMEEELKKAKAELEQRVEERTLELKENKQFMETLLNTTPDTIYVYDLIERRNVFINWEAMESLDYSKEDIQAMGDKVLQTLMHPDDLRNYLRNILPRYTKLKDREVIEHKYRMRHKDGSWHWLHSKELIFKRLEDGSPKQVFGLVFDITEERNAQDQLKRSEESLRTILEAMPFGTLLMEQDKSILAVNDAAVALMGYDSSEELVETFCYDTLCTSEKDNYPILDRGEPVDRAERTLRTKDGSEISVLKSVVPISINDKEVLLEAFVDITEMKQTQEALAESEQRYQLATRAANTGIWDWDVVSGDVYFSPRWKALLGYEDHEIVNDFATWEELLHPDEHDEKLKKVQDYLANPEGTFDLEFRMRHKDGSYRWIFNRAASILNDEGHPVRMFGSHVDITEGKLAQARIESLNALKETLLGQQSLEENLDHITQGVVDIFDADFARVWAIDQGDRCEEDCFHADASEGPHVCRHKDKCLHLMASSGRYTHTNGEVHTRVPFDCYKIGRVASGAIPSFITNDVQNDERVHNHQWSRELGLLSFAGYRLLSSDGEPIGVLALFSKHEVSPTEEALLEDLANTTAQVIQRSRAQEALRASEEKFRGLTEHLNVGVYRNTSGEEGRFLEANPAIVSMFGYDSREEFLQMSTASLYKDFEERSVFSQKLLEEGFMKNQVLELTRKDGSSLLGSVTALAVHDTNGSVLYYDGMIEDVTERKLAELRQNKLMEELERSNRDLQDFAYSVSHDLQAPLRKVHGFAGLLAKRYQGQLDDTGDRYISRVTGAATRMEQLINDLLDYSRITTQGRKLTASDSGEALSHALENLQQDIKLGEAEVTQDTLPMLKADQAQLTRVFQNLIGNAVKFRTEGIKPKIHVQAEDRIGEWLFSVQDNGIGMDLCKGSERVFKIFQRLHSAEEYEGTGIGLALCKRIVERHKGNIWVESEPGKGSTFKFTLPKQQREQEEEPEVEQDGG